MINIKELVVDAEFFEKMGYPMYTYLMLDISTGYTKIGKAKNPTKRLADLRVANPSLRLVAYIPSDCEKELHEKYVNKRWKGEFFDLTLDDMLWVSQKKGGEGPKFEGLHSDWHKPGMLLSESVNKESYERLSKAVSGIDPAEEVIRITNYLIFLADHSKSDAERARIAAALLLCRNLDDAYTIGNLGYILKVIDSINAIIFIPEWAKMLPSDDEEKKIILDGYTDNLIHRTNDSITDLTEYIKQYYQKQNTEQP